jgi:hypothetical protein
LSQIKNQIEGYFKKIKISWFGGSLESTNETNTRIVLTQGYQNPLSSDQSLDTEERPSISAQSMDLNASVYVNKAIIDNYTVPLRIETRQNTAGLAATASFMKDVFTVERRGHQDDPKNTVYEFQTIDRSRRVESSTKITETGQEVKLESDHWLSSLYIGDSVRLSFGSTTVSGMLEFADALKLTYNTSSLTINEILELIHGALTMTIDADGLVNITTPQFILASTSDNKLYVQVADGSKIILGDSEVDEQNNVLTPSTIFDGGVNYDTFTGLPFIGSTTVSAKK